MSEDPPVQTFTSADRIRQLNDIDKDVDQMIHSAGVAIQALTNTQQATDNPMNGSLESHKSQFKEAVSQYFSLLSSVDVRLRRQLYALTEAHLGAGSGGGDVGAAGTPSGLTNPLDVSWLNSRKDTVGKDKEAELWAVARRFIEQLEHPSDGLNGSVKQEDSESETMQVD